MGLGEANTYAAQRVRGGAAASREFPGLGRVVREAVLETCDAGRRPADVKGNEPVDPAAGHGQNRTRRVGAWVDCWARTG